MISNFYLFITFFIFYFHLLIFFIAGLFAQLSVCFIVGLFVYIAALLVCLFVWRLVVTSYFDQSQVLVSFCFLVLPSTLVVRLWNKESIVRIDFHPFLISNLCKDVFYKNFKNICQWLVSTYLSLDKKNVKIVGLWNGVTLHTLEGTQVEMSMLNSFEICLPTTLLAIL